jgi:tryptophan 2,3-dioxygenase
MISVSEAVLGQMRTLQRMAPTAFYEFRVALGPASGAQSRQFRHLEVLCEIRSEQHIAMMRAFDRGQLGADIVSALDEASLRETFLRAIQRRRIPSHRRCLSQRRRRQCGLLCR